MDTAHCISCNTDKPLDNFYVLLQGEKKYYTKRCIPCHSQYNHEKYEMGKRQDPNYIEKRYGNYKRQRQNKMMEFLKDKYCIDCGESNPIVLDFDHKDPTTKKERVSAIMSNWTVIMEEIEKCEIRCGNCHRIKTIKEREYYNGDI